MRFPLNQSSRNKSAFPVDRRLAAIREQRGKHLDPRTAGVFLDTKDEIIHARVAYTDVD
ncbi:MAG: hypothetical protein HUU20_12710 [Pirellulales bacterium]|nr:hypothetical protein [Pirellulales bacterium]